MWITTRGKYALRVIVDLAEHNNGVFVPLKDLAKRQGISEKYLESIMVMMSKAGIIQGMRGKGGGYRLEVDPFDLTIGRVLKVTERSLEPAVCAESAQECPQAAGCKTQRVWQELYRLIDDYLEGMTVGELAGQVDGGDFYVI